MVDDAPQVQAIRCTRCGGSLALRSASARTIVCQYCGAQLDLTSKDYAFLETLRRQQRDGPLHVGLAGSLGGIAYQVAGVIVWRDERRAWEDYFLVGPEGHSAWIRYDRFTYKLFQIFKPLEAEPIELQSIEPQSQFVDFGGAHYIILERQRAHASYLEGELPWRVRVNEELTMLQCDPAVSVEASSSVVRYFRWNVLPWQEVGKAFGLPDDVAKPDQGRARGVPLFESAGFHWLARGLVVLLFLLVVAALAASSRPPPEPGKLDEATVRNRLGLVDPPLRQAK